MAISEIDQSERSEYCHRTCALQSAPIVVLNLSLSDPKRAKTDYSNYRLAQFVTSRIDMEQDEILALIVLTGAALSQASIAGAREFEQHLRMIITRYGFSPLFQDDGPGRFHHAIRPTGYDYHTDKVHALGMRNWRAFYRGMSSERQMLAASILWLYRGRKDNRWLRRVPCTWNAPEGIHQLASTGLLSDWGLLIALYPGW